MKLKDYLLCITSFFLLLGCPALSLSAVIEGIVLSSSGPVENSKVYAYKTFDDIRHGRPSFSSAAGEKKGFYMLELPPGNYYLTASGKVDEKDYFSFHGANPVFIDEKKLWVPIMVIPETDEVVTDSPGARLTGRVTFRDRPVSGAYVSLYSPHAPSFRGMGFFTSTTDGEGVFSLLPEPGEYVVIARKRKDFSGIRPLIKGDLFCYTSANPVSVKPDGETSIDIPCYPKDDLKAFLDEKVYPAVSVKKSGEDSIRFRENRIEKKTGSLQIKGRVTDLNGNQVKDLYVMAYRGKPSTMFKMLYVRTMPEYMVVTDARGHYMIDAEEQGTYHIIARENIGEAPSKGEYYGQYEGNTDHAIVMKDSPIDDVNIVVSRVMAEDASGDTDKKEDAVDIKDFRYSEDTVIKSDTAWSGEITVSGTVHVMRGVTLTIAPGTVIKFRKVDENHDGVGDSRINVSGRLIAKGAYGQEILFTSAEEKPDKMDWSYLLFFVSGDDNIVEYCKFEYAFTGIQVHFSKAVISDSVFARNHEGIRFGRTELRVEHNDIFENTYGIRYTRLEGPVEIIYNNIRDNGVGIFHVPSNQNIVDFSATFSKKGTYHKWQPVVRYNNISYNDEYNFRLGERQGYHILLEENWWGSREEKDVKDLFYDETEDSALGRIVFKPFYTAPVKNAGVRKGG